MDIRNIITIANCLLVLLNFGKGQVVDNLIGDLGERQSEVQSYDGWYNNIGISNLGAKEGNLLRQVKASYSDGVYQMKEKGLPNPFNLSEQLMDQKNGNLAFGKRKSSTGKNVLLVFYGQHVVEEILDSQVASCPPEYVDIKIPEGHEYMAQTKHTKMPFVRTKYDHHTGTSPNNPRSQLNHATPWLDAGFLYGNSRTIATKLRTFKDGKLLTSGNGRLPPKNKDKLPLKNLPPPVDHKKLPIDRLYRVGNVRGNENPFLLAHSVIWLRWHNVIADYISKKWSHWTDERVFTETRKWVIATQQHITVNKWLPMWTNKNLLEYSQTTKNFPNTIGYNPTLNPGISTLFQSAAMRIGHTLVPSAIYMREEAPSCSYRTARLCNTFWEPYKIIKDDKEDVVKKLILGMTSQAAEAEDSMVVDDLRKSVYGPLEFSRRDLMALNIQRGRDQGLLDYLQTRRKIGLEANFTTFDEVSSIWPVVKDNLEILMAVESLYGDVNKIDVWVGGLLETDQGWPGELFSTITMNQFLRIRNADRFWFENINNGLFSEEEINRIKKLEFRDVLLSVTNINSSELHANVFQLPTAAEKPPCIDKFEHYNCSGTVCFALPDADKLPNCTLAESYDYFEGSETSYILTFLFLFLFVLGCIVVLFTLSKKRDIYRKEQLKRFNKKKNKSLAKGSITANEWVGGRPENKRQVVIRFDVAKKYITVSQMTGQALRAIDLSKVSTTEIQVSHGRSENYILIRVHREYDLVLKFANTTVRNEFIATFEKFVGDIGVGRQRREMNTNKILANAKTKTHRQKELEQFFRVVFAQAFSIDHDTEEMLKMNTDKAKQMLTIELTKHEFAESLSMKPNSTFINQMFTLVDKDENGYISFREFLDMITIFAKGTADEKIKLMFDMYDIDRTGNMTRKDFSNMIRSMLELANQTLKSEEIEQVINSMFASAGLQEKQSITLQDFMKLVADHKEELGYAHLNFKVTGVEIPKEQTLNRRKSAIHRARQTIVRALSDSGEASTSQGETKRLSNSHTNIRVEIKNEKYITDPLQKKFFGIIRLIENYKMHIFWITVYTLITIGIFAERMYYYAFKTEHTGLRSVAGYGVAVTRGSAAAMMFCFSTILLTMCRNILTYVRETFFHVFIPFDATISFHKYIAGIAMFFTVIHVIGHAINFYSISTQNVDDLLCLFRNVYFESDQLPKFANWCFTTITGITGIFLVMTLSIIYVFAMQYSRRHVFNAFWLTHNLYPLLYILIVLHGSGDLIQPPIFHMFFVGPCIVFTIDRLMSVTRKKVEISVVKAELLPSDVTHLEFKKPLNFEYKSGQWVRIASPVLNSNEYHPFTLSSAPHEENLSLHIRAVGPWTRNLRMTYDPDNLKEHAYPKIYLDGPYGEGHQDWYRYDVAVLVGGGIGVTPFASILKDIVFKSSFKAKFQCKKVYFIWVTRTEKHFEWLTDIIREVEDNDKANMVSVHIFITQFYQKFDLRTTMLYICERHFQKISHRSLFTGLRSITHFGRPIFTSFLDSLQIEHPDVTKMGVFSCGPPLMTRGVESACEDLNKRDQGAVFIHHFENF